MPSRIFIMTPTLLCVVRPIIAFEGTDESFIYQIISPIAKVAVIAIIHRSDSIIARIQLASQSSVLNIMCELHNRTFEWGRIEFIGSQIKGTLGDCPDRPSPTAKYLESVRSGLHDQAYCLSDNEPNSIPRHLIQTERVGVNSNSDVNSSQKTSSKPKTKVKSSSSSIGEDHSHDRESSLHLYQARQASPSSSKVVFFQSLHQKFLNGKMLGNILGCFGNVTRIVIDPRAKIAFGEFESPGDVNNAITNLRGVPFFGFHLSLSHASDKFDLDRLIGQDSSNLSITYIMSRFWRFRNRFRVKVNPPSNILHITSIDSEADLAFLYSIISLIQEPETIYLLKKRSKESKMYLIKFPSASQALEVLSLLHDKVVGTRMLKVSFSKMDL